MPGAVRDIQSDTDMPRVPAISGEELVPAWSELGEPIAIRANLLRSASLGVAVSTWASLLLVEGTAEGQRGEVPRGDSGSHTDPVTGDTVPNAGIYSWSTSPAGWKRISDPLLTSNAAPLPAGPWVLATLFLENAIASHLGGSFMSKLTHVSGADTEPGIGGDWEAFWVQIAEKGEEGLPGDPGTPGTRSEFYTAPGAPSGGLGVNGDNYLNATNGDVYRKIAGTWTPQGNLRGVPGTPGPGSGDMLGDNNLNDVADPSTAFDNIKQAATDAYAGVVERATTAEVKAGSDDARFATSAGIAAVYERKGKITGQNAQTDNYNFALSDAGKLVKINKATAVNATVLRQSTVAWEDDSHIELVQIGAGQITVVAGVGVTIRSTGAKLKLSGQYSAASLIRIASDEWLLVGDLVN